MGSLQRSLRQYVPVTAKPNIKPDKRVVLGPDEIGLLWGKGSSFDFSHGTIRVGGKDGFAIKLKDNKEKIKRRQIIDVEVQVERDERAHVHDNRIPGGLPGEAAKITLRALVPTDIQWTTKITLPRSYFGQATEPTRRYDYLFDKASEEPT